MTRDSLPAQLEDVIKRIREESYQRGWSDAISYVMSAARSAQTAAVKLDRGALAKPQRKASYGAIGEAIESCFRAFGDRGITPIDVVEHGREVYSQDLLESSVRGRLNRMGKRKEARTDRGRWFRVEELDEATEQEDRDGDLSPAKNLSDWSGRRNAAA